MRIKKAAREETRRLLQNDVLRRSRATGKLDHRRRTVECRISAWCTGWPKK